MENFDVVVLGGGLAGLGLSIQLKKTRPETLMQFCEMLARAGIKDIMEDLERSKSLKTGNRRQRRNAEMRDKKVVAEVRSLPRDLKEQRG